MRRFVLVHRRQEYVQPYGCVMGCVGRILISGELLEEGIEVFEAGVLDDDFAAALVIFDVDLQTEGALEALRYFLDVRIYGRLGLGLLLFALGVEEGLDISLRLTNRERKSDNALRSLLDFLGMLEGKEGSGMSKGKLPGLDAALHS